MPTEVPFSELQIEPQISGYLDKKYSDGFAGRVIPEDSRLNHTPSRIMQCLSDDAEEVFEAVNQYGVLVLPVAKSYSLTTVAKRDNPEYKESMGQYVDGKKYSIVHRNGGDFFMMHSDEDGAEAYVCFNAIGDVPTGFTSTATFHQLLLEVLEQHSAGLTDDIEGVREKIQHAFLQDPSNNLNRHCVTLACELHKSSHMRHILADIQKSIDQLLYKQHWNADPAVVIAADHAVYHDIVPTDDSAQKHAGSMRRLVIQPTEHKNSWRCGTVFT